MPNQHLIVQDVEPLGMETYVDPAILDVILAINKLPFVEQTTACCAGYDEHAPLNILPQVLGALPPVLNKHCMPYVTIQYQSSTPFHRHLLNLVANGRPAQFVPRAYSYYLLPSRKIRNVQELAEPVWQRIKELVTLWSTPEGRKEEPK